MGESGSGALGRGSCSQDSMGDMTWGGGEGNHGSAEERELICGLEVELIGLADGLGMSGKNREMTPNHRF